MKQFLIILLFLVSVNVSAQRSLKFDDSSTINLRSFNAVKLEAYKQDRSFKYENVVEPAASLWQRFWSWFWFKVNEILSTKTGRNAFWTALIVIAIAILTFTILKIRAVGKDSIFERDKGAGLPYTTSVDNIYHIDFDNEIERAIASANYRWAVRVLYLQSLKTLADAGLIDWKPNKTNRDYGKEIDHQKWSPLFNIITHHFDFTWYGEVALSEREFSEIRRDFITFKNEVIN